MAKKSLRDRAEKLSINLELMDKREKGDLQDILDKTVTINDYGFLKDEYNQEYIVFTISEDSANFYFGGQVLTEDMQELDADGFGDDIRKDGLPVMLEKKMSKNKREYTKVTYYPES